MSMTGPFLYAVVQVVGHGVDQLVNAALLVRLAELLNYDEIKLDIVPLEKQSSLKWTKIGEMLFRVDPDMDNHPLLSQIRRNAFAPAYRQLLASLLDDTDSPDYHELRARWTRLSELVMKRNAKEFERVGSDLTDWLRERLRELVTEVH